MRVKTDYVPERNRGHLTAGKEYETREHGSDKNLRFIVSDRGSNLVIRLSGSAPLDNRPWTIVEDKMNIKDAYIAMQAACGIKVGDTVKVLRKAESLEMGWGNVWSDDMDRLIGAQGVATLCDLQSGVRVNFEDDWFAFPFFVLQKIEKKWEPEVYDVHYWVNYMGETREHAASRSGGRLYGNESKTREDAEKIAEMNRRNQRIFQAKREMGYGDGCWEITVDGLRNTIMPAYAANKYLTFETSDQAQTVKEMVGL